MTFSPQSAAGYDLARSLLEPQRVADDSIAFILSMMKSKLPVIATNYSFCLNITKREKKGTKEVIIIVRLKLASVDASAKFSSRSGYNKLYIRVWFLLFMLLG